MALTLRCLGWFGLKKRHIGDRLLKDKRWLRNFFNLDSCLKQPGEERAPDFPPAQPRHISQPNQETLTQHCFRNTVLQLLLLISSAGRNDFSCRIASKAGKRRSAVFPDDFEGKSRSDRPIDIYIFPCLTADQTFLQAVRSSGDNKQGPRMHKHLLWHQLDEPSPIVSVLEPKRHNFAKRRYEEEGAFAVQQGD